MNAQARPATNIITRSSSDPYEDFEGDVAQQLKTSLLESLWVHHRDVFAPDPFSLIPYPSFFSTDNMRFIRLGAGLNALSASSNALSSLPIEGGNFLTVLGDRPILQHQSVLGSYNTPGYADFVSPALPLNVGLRLSNAGKIRDELEAGIAGADSRSESFDAHIDAVVSYALFKYGYDLVTALTRDFSNSRGIDDTTHIFMRSLSRISDTDSLFIRRNILGAALNAASPSVRYAAAVALGDIGDRISLSHLKGRQPLEKNSAVRNMIKAQML